LSDLFPPTRWTLVLAARAHPEQRRRALQELVAPRWKALYVLARAQGLPPADAEDAVQSFLARVVEGDLLDRLDPARGRLRAFLRSAFRNHLLNLHEHAAAAKRGGGRRDADLADVEALVATPGSSPEALFERAWAVAVFEESLAALEEELGAGPQQGALTAMRALFRFGAAPAYADLAAEMGTTIAQLKSSVHRAKRRFGALLRARVADTLDDGDDVDGEVAALLGALAS
jgi:DNA-directed RNA polymerase specialized sigma24 family protein